MNFFPFVDVCFLATQPTYPFQSGRLLDSQDVGQVLFLNAASVLCHLRMQCGSTRRAVESPHRSLSLHQFSRVCTIPTPGFQSRMHKENTRPDEARLVTFLGLMTEGSSLGYSIKRGKLASTKD